MNDPKVTLVTSLQYPQLRAEEQKLPQLLKDRGIEVEVRPWNDPNTDWDNAGVCVLRSLGEYDVNSPEFLQWAKSIKRLLNPVDIIEWNRDRHFLKELSSHGINTVPTVWLEAENQLRKIQVHSRFPSSGDFVVKPVKYTHGVDVGRYSANSVQARGEAILHAMDLLENGKSVMVQKYLDEIDVQGEISLVYMNGILSYAVERKANLHSSYKYGDTIPTEEVKRIEVTPQLWLWSEQVRSAIHKCIVEKIGHDLLLLYSRIDLVHDGKGGYVLMDAPLIDSTLYFNCDEQLLENFANAISARVFW